MEDLLKNALDENETLLWSGRPENFEVFDKTNKKCFVKKAVIAAIVSVLLIGAYALMSVPNGNFKFIIVVIILVFAGYSPLNVLMDANKLKKKIGYAITDKRLLTVLDSAKGIPYSAIDCAALRTDEDGHVTLLCGPDALNSKPGDWRAFTVIGAYMDDSGEKCDRYAMYALPDAERVKAILKPYLNIE